MQRLKRETRIPDWQVEVEKLPMHQLYPEIQDSRKYSDKFVIVSKDKNVLYNVVSQHYQLVRHEDALKRVEDEFKRSFKSSMKEKTVISLDHGASIKATFPLEGVVDPIILNGDDQTNLSLMLYNSYDGRFALKAALGLLRLICMNGAVVFEQWSTISTKHFGSMEGMDVFGSRLNLMLNNASHLGGLWENWKDFKVGFDDQITQEIYNRFPKKYVKPLSLKARMPVSKFDLYNMMTQMITHKVRSEKTRIGFDQEVSKLFYSGRYDEAS